MATNPNWPLTVTQVAFNAGPADPAAAPSWSDLSARTRELTSALGRQYELDQIEAGTGSFVFSDKDEVLNPANTGSPYYLNVLPYRQIIDQAMWPPTPVGGAVNLLNAATDSSPRDPSFESYTAGAAVSWLTAAGATNPVIGTTTPHAGTKDVTWTVAGTSTIQGVSWPIPCIPGQQYTCSAYVRQSSASTQRLSLLGQLLLADPFGGRTVASGWGTPPVGGAYATSGGSASDYSVAGGVGVQSSGTVNALRYCSTTVGQKDQTVYSRFVMPVVAAGDSITVWTLGRMTDTSNYYAARCDFATDSTVTLRIAKRLAGTLSTVATAPAVLPYTAGSEWHCSFDLAAGALTARMWATSSPNNIITLTGTDTSLTTGNLAGFATRLETANTNTLPVAVRVGYLQAQGIVPGSSTATTGSYQRLTLTFTATQPQMVIRLATEGTAVAGTVLLDDVQHEPGASASTFTTAGPVIDGVARHFVERWPSHWNHNGLYGMCEVTTVDMLAALAATDADTAYATAIYSLRPDYFWRLNDGTTTGQFADSSGNQRDPLSPLTSKYGAGTALQPGTSIAITGDPGASAVKFTYNGPPGQQQPGTLLTTTHASIPPVPQTVWAMTVSAWIQLTTGDPDGQNIIVIGSVQNDALAFGTASAALYATSTNINFAFAVGFTVGTISQASTPLDGKVHHVAAVLTMDASGPSATVTVYIDGVSNSTVYGGLSWSTPMPFVRVGAGFVNNGVGQPANGSIADAVIWNRALSAAEIASLWAAGGSGNSGDTTGGRINRTLAAANYLGQTSIDVGATTMGVDTTTTGTPSLEACQAHALTENGPFWADQNGVITFRARTARYLNITPKWVFGENELPYEDDIAYDYDPTLVYNDVSVTRSGGTTSRVLDLASQRAYFRRSYSRTINPLTDAEAVSASNWILATHKDPWQRIQTLTIKPSSNPALWPVALGARLNDRITVKRRTTAGLMSADYFIERIEHSRKAGEWLVHFQCSPAPPSQQPWILGDATYGVLNSTTVLGW